MKPQHTFAFLLLFFTSALSAQVEFKVKLLPDNETYQVLFRSNASWAPPLNATPSAQVTVRVPTGGFSVGSVNSLQGTWGLDTEVEAPAENPSFDYFIFGLQGATSDITYTEGEEVVVFEFTNNGSCTGAVELIDNDNDPFTTNSMNIGVNNTLAVIGAGIGQNAYLGNYGAISADCTPSSACGIEIFDIILTPPSACGVADGSIEIVATTTGGLPLQYRINDTGPGSAYQSSPIFTGLSAGEEFEITVRDIAAICSVEAGTFELPGPLAAVITGVDIVQPDCGMDNGSITINAVPQNGGVLEYGVGDPPVYQSSATFNDLAEGTYTFYVQDIVNNCDQPAGTYTLTGCQEPECILTYDIEYLGDGVYQVNLTSDTTWLFPNNITSSMMVTIKVPTGGFVFDNLTSQVTNVQWTVGSTYEAPAEAPNYDYISVNMNSPGTQNIPYNQGETFPLFTFENTGTCEGDSIFLMQPDDPFTANQNANVGQQAFTTGSGEDIIPCLGVSTLVCETVPVGCLITYELEKIGPNNFQVSMIPDVTWNNPSNITSSFQVSIKVPAGGFDMTNLTSQITGVNWSIGSTYVAPDEEPTYDYITVTLNSPGTSNISYQTGVKVPLFTFENGGTCQDADILLMDNDTDPFAPQNQNAGTNANVGQQLFTVGSSEDVQACIINNPANDCNEDPCIGLTTSFTAADACEGESIAFNSTTTSTETVTSWEWEFGDNPVGMSSDENPTYTYSNSGNFEVSLTVTTESGCIATFSEFVTVFSLPGTPSTTEYLDCNGSGVQLSAPDADMVTWSPTTGLDDANISNPFANPSQTTTYTVTLTTTDGCTTATDVTVNVSDKPIFQDVFVTPASDCGVQDASLQIDALGTGTIEYSIDGGATYSPNPNFADLAAGSYVIFIRNADDQCEVAYNGNPVVINDLMAPSIDDVTIVDPTGCNPDGSITVIASGGEGSLMYELTGQSSSGPSDSNIFTGLMEGSYTVIVTNENGSCAQIRDVELVGQGNNLMVQTGVPDQNLCVSSNTTVTIILNQDISSFNITGGSFSNESINGNMLTFDLSANMGANNYNVDFTSVMGCTLTESFIITGVAEPVPSFNNSSTLCVDGNVTLNYTGTGSGQITWDIADGNIANGDLNSSPLVVTFGNQGDRQVCVTMEENGCQVQSCQTITVSSFDPQASFDSNDPTCGNSDGAIDLSANGSYTYDWSGPGISDPSLEDQMGLPGGTYTIEITDPNSGCSTQEQIILDTPTSITVVLNSEDASDCIGNSGSGSITAQVSGGNGNFVYELFEGGNSIATQNTSASVYTFENLGAGAYTVQVTLNGSCTDDEMTTISSSSTTLSATSTAEDADCGLGNGTVAVEISGGEAPYTYDIIIDNVPQGAGVPVTGNSFELSSLMPGNVQLLIYDNTGCIAPIAETINEEPVDLSMVDATIVAASCGGADGSIVLTGVPNGSLVNWVDKLDNPTISVGLGNELQAVATSVYTAQILTATGCSAQMDFTVGTQDVEIAIDAQTDASCGNNDGSVTFTITGIADFFYEIPGQNEGFGQNGVPVTVNGLSAGNHIVSVEDLVSPGCNAFETFETGDNIPSSVAITAIPYAASECGIADGTIEINIISGDGAYSVTSDQGDVPNGPFIDQTTITGLYTGEVMVTLTDEATGCSLEILVPMQEVDEPNVLASLDTASVTDYTCPDEFGSILSAGFPMEVFEMDGTTSVGMTPQFGLVPGTYIVRQTLGACVDEESFIVDGPAAFDVQEVVSLESCEGLDGGIEVSVSGGNGNYTYLWSNSSTSEDLTGVSTGIYQLTITDEEGCTHVAEFNVDYGCGNPCDDIFLIDTFLVELQGENNKICLPTEYADLSIFDLSLNNSSYTDDLGSCAEISHSYGYSLILSFGEPPYLLNEWAYRNVKAPEFEFYKIEDLVDYMNLLDPYGNWAMNAAQGMISGGEPGANYGAMVFTHVASATTLTQNVATINIDHPSIIVDGSPYHMFIAQDPTNADCADTLYINLANSQPDTMIVTVPLGETVTPDCLPTLGLSGIPESISNVCQSATYNAQLISTGDVCVQFYGLSVGTDTYCMEICDDLGNCIIVTVIVEVTEDDEFEIFNGFSPNGDGKNDYFRIKGIERYPNNTLTIFNRWGSKVYSKSSYTNKNPWIAEYKNTYLASGSYFYILEIEMDGKQEVFSGLVEVRR